MKYNEREKTDHEEFWEILSHSLEDLKINKIGGTEFLCYISNPNSFDDNVKCLRLVEDEELKWKLQFIEWYRSDVRKLGNPHEKVKFFGNYRPKTKERILEFNSDEKLFFKGKLDKFILVAELEKSKVIYHTKGGMMDYLMIKTKEWRLEYSWGESYKYNDELKFFLNSLFEIIEN
jgi:hypothetical protein